MGRTYRTVLPFTGIVKCCKENVAVIAERDCYRFVVLFFNCLATFGTYFCFDMPSVLQDVFQKGANCSYGKNSTDCEDGLGLTGAQYNSLYAISAWSHAVVVMAAGFLIDKLGNRVGLFLFSGLCLLGSSLFAVGAVLKGSAAMFPIMLIGRLFFGSGNGSLIIVQDRISAFWFREKELAFAFSVTLTFSRLGSVLNFFVTKSVEEQIGLTWTLWGGAALCLLSFVATAILAMLDVVGIKQLGMENRLKQESKRVRFSDIRHFNRSYWLITLTSMFFYNAVFPFVADASQQNVISLLLIVVCLSKVCFTGRGYLTSPSCKFIQDKYNYSDTSPVPSYLAGTVYDVSLLLSPFLGFLVDIIGMRGYLILGCSLFTIPVFVLLAFTNVYPLVSTVWLGITFSIIAATLWPSIPLVVPPETVGMAMGVTSSVIMIGIGLCNIIIGEILDLAKESDKWTYVMMFLFPNILACVVTSFVLNVVDRHTGHVLNQTRKGNGQQNTYLEDSIQSSGEDRYEYPQPTDYDPLLRDFVAPRQHSDHSSP